METSSFRILIADSFERRHYVRSTFQKDQSLQIAGEPIDGLESVQKAVELKTDLVLLSVGLSPHLNGIEAAKPIIKAVPDVKEPRMGVLKSAFHSGKDEGVLLAVAREPRCVTMRCCLSQAVQKQSKQQLAM